MLRGSPKTTVTVTLDRQKDKLPNSSMNPMYLFQIHNNYDILITEEQLLNNINYYSTKFNLLLKL